MGMITSFLEIWKLKLRPLPKATKVIKSYVSRSGKQDWKNGVQFFPGWESRDYAAGASCGHSKPWPILLVSPLSLDLII